MTSLQNKDILSQRSKKLFLNPLIPVKKQSTEVQSFGKTLKICLRPVSTIERYMTSASLVFLGQWQHEKYDRSRFWHAFVFQEWEKLETSSI